MTRGYKRWSDDDTSELRRLSALGETCYAVAKALGRDPKVVRETADRLGVVFAAPKPVQRKPSSGPVARATLDIVAAALHDGAPRTAKDLAATLGEDYRKVNGVLAALLRQGRVVRIDSDRWAASETETEPRAPTGSPRRSAEIEQRAYHQTAADRDILEELQAGGDESCATCAHYSGPLLRAGGRKLVGRCLVLGVSLVPCAESMPCGQRSFDPA